jgi:hypothetical protein
MSASEKRQGETEHADRRIGDAELARNRRELRGLHQTAGADPQRKTAVFRPQRKSIQSSAFSTISLTSR